MLRVIGLRDAGCGLRVISPSPYRPIAPFWLNRPFVLSWWLGGLVAGIGVCFVAYANQHFHCGVYSFIPVNLILPRSDAQRCVRHGVRLKRRASHEMKIDCEFVLITKAPYVRRTTCQIRCRALLPGHRAEKGFRFYANLRVFAPFCFRRYERILIR